MPAALQRGVFVRDNDASLVRRLFYGGVLHESSHGCWNCHESV
jgi:hypothetical protein